MEALAFVEVVDRHREVVARHPVYRWPITVGRGYGADVIVDDPFVAPLHVKIDASDDARFHVSDLDSVNGISLSTSGERVESAEIGCDDLVRLGHTQIRMRTPGYAVPPERRLLALALYRRVWPFIAMAALMIAVFGFNAWVMTTDDEDQYTMLFPILGMTVAVGLWISVWSFVSSAIGRRPNFAAHGFVACAGVLAIIAVSALFEYLAFGFNSRWLDYVGLLAFTAIVFYMIYRHLLLNSRARRRNLLWVSAGVSAALFAGTVGLNFLIDRIQEGTQDYSDAIKAPAFLFVDGTSPETFLSDAEALKRKVDRMAKNAKK